MAVTNVPFVSQCAEIHKMAFGVGNVRATICHPLENSLSSIPFIGLPCPINKTGICGLSESSGAMGPTLHRLLKRYHIFCYFYLPGMCPVEFENF